MKNSIKQIIIQHLEAEYGDKWCWGGVLARAIHDQTGTKESVVERRARELVKSGVLETTYEQIDGKGARCVRYRVATPEQDEIQEDTTSMEEKLVALTLL